MCNKKDDCVFAAVCPMYRPAIVETVVKKKRGRPAKAKRGRPKKIK